MASSLSTQPQSRDQMLDYFQKITGLDIGDCIQFLNQYNWKLEDIVNDYYNGKEFKEKSLPHSNEKKQNTDFQQKPSYNPNLGNLYTKNDGKKQPDVDNDRHYAQIVHLYGDADASARRQWKEQQQQQYQQQSQYQQQPQYQQLPKVDTKNGPIYHEKQEYLRCGVHALNNLFQKPQLFTHVDLDNIVRKYNQKTLSNDYGTLWVGDYDLRVLIEAIDRYGCTVRQINFYRDELQQLPWDYYFGLLLNLNSAHWFTIKNHNGIYYNLDSTLKKPKPIGQKHDLVKYLIQIIHNVNDVYIFAVLQQTNRAQYS